MKMSLSFVWESQFWDELHLSLCSLWFCSGAELRLFVILELALPRLWIPWVWLPLDKPSIRETSGFLAVDAKLLPLHFSPMEKMLNRVVGRWCHLRARWHNSQRVHSGVGKSHTQDLLPCFLKLWCSCRILVVPQFSRSWCCPHPPALMAELPRGKSIY